MEAMKRETRRYAKRQLTWFGREEKTVWLYTDDYAAATALTEAALRIAKAHFSTGSDKRKCAR